MVENQDSKVIKNALAGEETLKGVMKLKLEKFDININPKKFLLEYTEEELKKLKAIDRSGLSEEENADLDRTEKILVENVERYRVAKLEAVMVPLKYKDLQAIKDGVLEAIKYAKQFNWDDDIKVRAMVREEHTLTVYLSLRKKEDISKRYFNSLEDIAVEVETLIEDLYKIYVDNFVLTDSERKNY